MVSEGIETTNHGIRERIRVSGDIMTKILRYAVEQEMVNEVTDGRKVVFVPRTSD